MGYVNESEKRSMQYHVDHIFSVSRGFLQKIHPAIVGHWTNLRMLDGNENSQKSWKCHKTKKELIEDFYASCLL